ncbi:MAG: hypothetical protein AB1757_28745 [Acidobacteriota bacterium]
MQTTLEQIIEAASRLSPEEIHKLGEWVREKESQNSESNGKPPEVEEEVRKFNLAMKWIRENRDEYLGKWVCLDGDRLISSGEDAVKVYHEAIAKGIEIPFVNEVREEAEAYLGGWEGCQ